ncbi:hypothetical protein BD626DRAFT_67510 [Schizophyllum amplum]|uniref:Uncharacterized protein n=1 Tax=Schizophyllum amplum TaxID=97359 RepID=A0A550CBD3_9AGAR|nr:hypothetical protein BD626DRAFT_67510 [Auriculariopsis ampla]
MFKYCRARNHRSASRWPPAPYRYLYSGSRNWRSLGHPISVYKLHAHASVTPSWIDRITPPGFLFALTRRAHLENRASHVRQLGADFITAPLKRLAIHVCPRNHLRGSCKRLTLRRVQEIHRASVRFSDPRVSHSRWPRLSHLHSVSGFDAKETSRDV